MNKREFLEKLCLALNGRVAPGVVTENVNYYEDYINVEVRKGRNEEEVLAQLGDPRLIARTIIQTNERNQTPEDGKSTDFYGNRGGSDSYYKYNDGGDTGSNGRRFRIPVWMVLILLLVAVVVILSFVFSIVTALLPVLLPIVAVIFLVKLFRDWVN